MFGTSTLGASKKKAFVVPQRTVFDFVATRDLSALKDTIDLDPSAAAAARDANGYSLLHVAAAHGHIDICRALLGIAEPPQLSAPSPLGQGSNSRAASAAPSPTKASAAGKRTSAAVSSAADEAAAVNNAEVAEGVALGDADGASNVFSGVFTGGAVRPKSRSSAAARRTEAAQRLAGNSGLHPSELPAPVRLPIANVDVNAASAVGYTALHVAAMVGCAATVDLLLSRGADPNAITRFVGDGAGLKRSAASYASSFPASALAVASPAAAANASADDGSGTAPPAAPAAAIASAEPLTAYQLARKHGWPAIAHRLEPLTLTAANGCRAGVVTRDGQKDAAIEFVESLCPLRAAEEGNVLYFSLALLDLCGPNAVTDAAKHLAGKAALDRIRSAVCKKTGRNVLMIVLDRPDVTSLPPPPTPTPTDDVDASAAETKEGGGGIARCGHNYTLIAEMLMAPNVLGTAAPSSGPNGSAVVESAFAAGLRYPSWAAYRLGYVFPVAADGSIVRPRLRSDEILERRRAEAERRAAAAEGDGEEGGDGDDGEEEGDGGAEDGDGEGANALDTTGAPTNGEDDADADGNDEASGASLLYSVNAQNASDGSTALHYAARHGHAAIVAALVAMGADATARDLNALTPRAIAASSAPPTARGGGASASYLGASLSLSGGVAKGAAPPSLAACLLEAEMRRRYLDSYNRRDDVLPDDRPQFAEEARVMKRRWRDADRLCRGISGPNGSSAAVEGLFDDDADAAATATYAYAAGGDADDGGAHLSAGRDRTDTAPSSPQRGGDDDGLRGHATAPTPAPDA